MSTQPANPVMPSTAAPDGVADRSSVPREPVQFVQLFTKAQRPLYLFLLGLTGRSQDADELLQNTNLVIWSKAGQFDPGSNFFAWACQIARYEVLQHRQRYQRDRLKFSDEFIDVVAQETVLQTEDLEPRRKALEACLQKLSARDRELISRRYEPGVSGKDVAEKLGRPQNAVYQSLGRIRRVLLDCIQRRIAES